MSAEESVENDAVADADVKVVHPDYPTPIPALNEMYRDHARRCRDHFSTRPIPPVECDNYRPPLTCLTAPSSEAGRCDKCRVTPPAKGVQP